MEVYEWQLRLIIEVLKVPKVKKKDSSPIPSSEWVMKSRKDGTAPKAW